MKPQEIAIEVLSRLDTLTKEYNLTRNVFYSYQYDRTILVSCDFNLDIKTVKGLVDIDTAHINGVRVSVYVEKFEFKYRNCKVYHVIESDNKLVLLYINENKKEWVNERPNDGPIKAYVYDTKTLKGSFESVKLSSKENVLEVV